MSASRRTSTARLFAATAGALLALSADLLIVEAVLAARRSYLPADSAPDIIGEYGDVGQPLVRLVVLGDSTAAGLGVDATDDSVGGQLARRLADRGHRVSLTGVAVSGSRAGDLGPQVSRALLGHPDVAVVLIGANDATHAASGRRMVIPLVDAIRRLREAGVPVVLGCCPDLGGARAFARPLRDLHAVAGRRVADAQMTAGSQAGALTVDLAAETGPSFRADPTLLSTDAFHPNAAGYALWTAALLPSVLEAVGLRIGDPS